MFKDQPIHKFEKLSSGHRTGKDQLSFQAQRKLMPKNAQTTAQLHSSHMLARYWSKFSKWGFNSTWTMNFQMFKLNLEKTEGEIKLLTSIGSLKKQESSRKTSISALLTKQKPLMCRLQQTLENYSRDGNIRPPDLPPEKSVCRSRSNS